jgi:hypothetical protein
VPFEGLTARYFFHEETWMRSIIAMVQTGRLDEETGLRELRLVHTLKAKFEAFMLREGS